MTSALTPYLLAGEVMPRMGNTGFSALPTASVFTTRDDRRVSLGVVQPRQFAVLAPFLGREDWLTGPRYATSTAQRENFDAPHAEVATEIARHNTAELEQQMSARGIPCGMIHTVGEAASLPSAGSLQPIGLASVSPDYSPATPGAGFRMQPEAAGTDAPLPRLDQHRAEIPGWLKLKEATDALG